MADTSASALPAPRQLLAELVQGIAAIPAADSDGAANPLLRVPHDQRPLLATLHVLFPALLLPALDLLDRRRVVRWGGERRQPRPPRRESAPASAVDPPPPPSPSSPSPSSPVPLYQIRGGSDRAHVVHLRAWHCTCAFFALRASSVAEDGRCDRTDAKGTGTGTAALAHLPLAFSTPPCKHLLACLLAEEWAALDRHVVAGEDGLAPETAAGIVAGVL